jgi:hypothetical protein
MFQSSEPDSFVLFGFVFDFFSCVLCIVRIKYNHQKKKAMMHLSSVATVYIFIVFLLMFVNFMILYWQNVDLLYQFLLVRGYVGSDVVFS